MTKNCPSPRWTPILHFQALECQKGGTRTHLVLRKFTTLDLKRFMLATTSPSVIANPVCATTGPLFAERKVTWARAIVALGGPTVT